MVNQSILPFVAALAVGGLGFCQSACKSCNAPEAPVPASNQPQAALAAPAAAPLPAAASAVAAPEPVSPDVYPGPRSEALDGWRITTGFSSLKDEQLSEPKALDDTKIYLTVLDAGGHPIGQLDKLERAEMHVFLVPRDLRYALYAHGSGPVKEGADARMVQLRSPEGGDHALIAVFKAKDSHARVVSAPVTIKGVLPEVMGPGLGSLGPRAKSEADHVVLTTAPATITVGQPVTLAAQDLGPAGQARGELRLPFVVVLNDQFGWGDVVEWNAEGKAVWTARKPGDYLVLAPPTRGSKALAFRLHADAPPTN